MDFFPLPRSLDSLNWILWGMCSQAHGDFWNPKVLPSGKELELGSVILFKILDSTLAGANNSIKLSDLGKIHEITAVYLRKNPCRRPMQLRN